MSNSTAIFHTLQRMPAGPKEVSGRGLQQRALLMMPSLSTSGGMCVTVPVVLVSTRLTRSRLRARPKSEILAQNPCGLA